MELKAALAGEQSVGGNGLNCTFMELKVGNIPWEE